MEWLCDTHELNARLGYVGSVRAFNPWQSRRSVDTSKRYVADIAALSYGSEEAKNPEVLYNRILRDEHLSCLEFIPWIGPFQNSLPEDSFRGWHNRDGANEAFSMDWEADGNLNRKAIGFLIECPIFVARQWMRHRSFAYLEMSRRYVKESKVPATFYAEGKDGPEAHAYAAAVMVYNELIDNGEPAELARRVLPVGMMTRFYCAGFVDNWEHFLKLRTDSHAQEEIRVFANTIRGILDNVNF